MNERTSSRGTRGASTTSLLLVSAAAFAVVVLIVMMARSDRAEEPRISPLGQVPPPSDIPQPPIAVPGTHAQPQPLAAAAASPTIAPDAATAARAAVAALASAPASAAPLPNRSLDVVVVDAQGKPVADSRVAVFLDRTVSYADFVREHRGEGHPPTKEDLAAFLEEGQGSAGDPAWGEPVSTWTTGPEGKAHLDVPGDSVLLVATHGEHDSSGVVTVAPAKDGSAPPWLRIVLSPRGTIHGLVLDRAGQPAPGARVIFDSTSNFLSEGNRPRTPQPLVADSLGRFTVDVDTKYFGRVHAERDGLRSIKAFTSVLP